MGYYNDKILKNKVVSVRVDKYDEAYIDKIIELSKKHNTLNRSEVLCRCLRFVANYVDLTDKNNICNLIGCYCSRGNEN